MIKYTSTVSSKLLVEGGFSSNLERYNNLYQPGIEKDRGSAAWFANARHVDRQRRLDQHRRRRPVRQLSGPLQHAGVGVVRHRYRTRSRSASRTRGARTTRTSRANADLYQNYTTNATTGLPVPSTVTLLATPSHWQDKLNANLGIYGQDVHHLQARDHHARRPLRVHQRAGHRAGRADRPLREHPGVRRHPDADAGRSSRRARRSCTT